MADPSASSPPASIRLPDAPILVATASGAIWLEPDGEILELSRDAAARKLVNVRPVLVHARSAAARLGIDRFAAFDLLDLYAFVRPATFCLPTPRGLIEAMSLPVPRNHAEEALGLLDCARLLLQGLAALEPKAAREAAAIAATMAKAGWSWGPAVQAALGEEAVKHRYGGLDIWERLTEWSDAAPTGPPEQAPVSGEEARERLMQLRGTQAEARPQQADYAATAVRAFAPRDLAGAPNLVLAEAGTGTGKTLGYIAPASLWAEKNGGAVWLSTFTKNLQRQIDQELDRLYPDPAVKAQKAVVRKGRENYLCLLNFEEAVEGGAARPADTVTLGLLARWARASRDGDMVGGDFPAWLIDLHGGARTIGLTDRRGECIYSACTHYRKCFVERVVRKARRAEIVIANHALIMVQAAAGDYSDLPTRYVFDEGHHVFGAADSAFSAHLSGVEGSDLRRWLRGPEGGRRSRGRGLQKRIGDLVAANEAGDALLQGIVHAAQALPGEGWQKRLTAGEAVGPAEAFLALARQQVLARAKDAESTYAIECPTTEPIPGLLEAASRLGEALRQLVEPMQALIKLLQKQLDDEAAELDTATRQRMQAAIRGLERRKLGLIAWRAMLRDLASATPPAFVDFFSIEREAGREADVGLHRHWIDPGLPFAETVLKPAHGALITSATLRDRTERPDASGDTGDDWESAEIRSGVRHLPLPALRNSVASPFNYAERTRVFVVTDIRRDAVAEVASAYRELFLAAGGGALGLFTAIWRLRAVQSRIAAPLDAAGIPLYAQHVDPLDTATLVDIFRAEMDSCLLGTDAVRDGVDVPGRSLRLIVFDRVPWPRPDLLHKARRAAFGKQSYDDMLTRLKLKQAYGRLLRRADDVGVFVMLDSMLPSRLLSALPPDVEVKRLGLAEAVAETRNFLNTFPAAQALPLPGSSF